MKKVFLSLALVLASTLQIIAKPVTKDIAYLQAQLFLQEKGVYVDVDSLTIIEGPMVNQETVAYYVVNNGNDGGFVIISGDDRGKAILGYSETGHFDKQNVNEQMDAMLNGYAEQMVYLDEHDFVGVENNGMARTQTPTGSPIQPMITTKWGQKDPFNLSTPVSGTKHTLAGCVCVAVSQLVYYYRDRMPDKVEKDIPGYTKGGYTVNTVKKGTDYNWNNMYDAYNATQTSSQLNNVANLILYVGMALQTTYGTSKTGTVVQTIPQLMHQYFNYVEAQFVPRANFTYEQWKELILNELEQGRPVLLSASVSTSSGHSFIIDGYDGGDLFHINWGWCGNDNGYFSLSILNHSDLNGEDAMIVQGLSYIYNQQVLLGFQPQRGFHDVDNTTKLDALNNSLTNSNGTYTLKVTYTNKTANKRTFVAGIGYKDDNENIQVFKQWTNGEVNLESGQGTGAISYTISAADFTAKKLVTGKKYKLYPISKIKNGDWEFCNQNAASATFVNCNYASTSSMTASLSSPTPSLSVTSFEYPGAKYANVKQYVKVKITNTGDDFYGNVYLFANSTSSKGSPWSYIPTYVPAGKSISLYLYFTPSAEAKYNVWVTTASNGSSVIGQSSVSISSGSFYRYLVPAGLTVNNCTNKSITGTTFAGTLKVKNSAGGTFAGLVKVQLCWIHPTKGKWLSIDDAVTRYMEIGAGATKDFEFKFENLNPACTYGLFYEYGDNDDFWYDTSYVLDYHVSYAVMCYNQLGELTSVISPKQTVTIPADAVAVDLTGTTKTVTKVEPNSKTNTLYYVGVNDTKPSGLTNKNFVKGAKADNITLVEKEPFYVLNYFIANKISFTLTPTIGAPKSGVGGWQTFVMPFSPTSVTCDNYPLEWFKSKNDEKKHFWVKEFSALQGASNVCFGFAQTINANQPYLYTVPNHEWGANNNLVGKNIVFSASNVMVHADPVAVSASSAYNFRGTYTGTTLSNIYTLDSNGTKFVKGKATVKPFACYFVATQNDNTDVNALNITSFDPDEETGIMALPTEEKVMDVFNLGGMKVGCAVMKNGQVDLGNLPKGIYVIDGKKIVK